MRKDKEHCKERWAGPEGGLRIFMECFEMKHAVCSQRCLSVKWGSNIMTTSLPGVAKTKILFPAMPAKKLLKWLF